MTAGRTLALIAAGYALALAGGVAAVAVNEMRMPPDVAQASSGMVAFGDMVLFVLVAGGLGLAPSWFLLRWLAGRAPGWLLAGELAAAVLGPLSWLAVVGLSGPPGRPGPAAPGLEIVGPLIAFVAFPRIVLGPVLVVIEAASLLLLRARLARALLIAAMLMDIVPLGLFALHMASAIRR